MAERINVDIVIVGSGLVGSALACALSEQTSYSIALVDRAQAATPPEGETELRVIAVTAANQKWLEAMHAWPTQLDRIGTFRAMHVWEDNGAVSFDSADIGEPALGYIVENNALLASMQHSFANADNLSTLYGTDIEKIAIGSDKVSVKLSGDKFLQASLLVGADGAQSSVRDAAGIGTRSWTYGQKAIVATIHTELDHQDTAWQRFRPEGPLALLPLAQNQCSIVWSNDSHNADALMALSDDEFNTTLTDNFEHRLGKLELRSKRACFPLKALRAERYVADRVALIGNAIHTVHPLAGQGANLGFQDAQLLTETLAAAKADFSSFHTLRRYERARKAENLAVASAIDGLKHLFGNSAPIIQPMRNLGLSLTNTCQPIKNLIMRQASGLLG